MDDAEHDLLAYMCVPKENRSKLRSTTPIERLSGEIKRSTDVVTIFPNDGAFVVHSLVLTFGALLLEQSEQ